MFSGHALKRAPLSRCCTVPIHLLEIVMYRGCLFLEPHSVLGVTTKLDRDEANHSVFRDESMLIVELESSSEHALEALLLISSRFETLRWYNCARTNSVVWG